MLEDKDQEKNGISSKFHFLRNPLGLKNAPSTFQRLVDELFGDLLRCTAVYWRFFQQFGLNIQDLEVLTILKQAAENALWFMVQILALFLDITLDKETARQ